MMRFSIDGCFKPRWMMGTTFFLISSLSSGQFVTAQATGYTGIYGQDGAIDMVQSSGGGLNAPDAFAEITGEFAVTGPFASGTGGAHAYGTKLGKSELYTSGAANLVDNSKYFTVNSQVSFRDYITITGGAGNGFLRVSVIASGGQVGSNWGSYTNIATFNMEVSTTSGETLRRAWKNQNSDPNTNPFFGDPPFAFREDLISTLIPFTYGQKLFIGYNCNANTTMPTSDIRSGKTFFAAGFEIDSLSVYGSDGMTRATHPKVESAYENTYSVNPVPEPNLFIMFGFGTIFLLRKHRG